MGKTIKCCATGIIFEMLAISGILAASYIEDPPGGPQRLPQIGPQAAGYTIRHWSVGDGLPRRGVTALAQTPDGYLWCGTPDGLVRFDGKRFKIYYPDEVPALEDFYITKLHCDKDGRLWIVDTNMRVAVLENGKFRRMSQSDGLPKGKGYPNVSSRDGAFWLRGPEPDSFFRFTNGHFEHIGAPDYNFENDDADARRLWGRRLYADSGKLRWAIAHGPLQVAEDGEKVLDVHLQKIEGRKTTGAEVQGAGSTLFELHSFFMLSDGAPGIVSRDGIYFLENDQWKLKLAFDLPIVKSHGSPQFALDDGEGNFWIGTHYGGLVIVSENGKTRHFSLPKEARRSNVQALMMDDSGSIWVATDDGLYQIRKRIMRSWTMADGMPENGINAIVEGRQGRIWIAVDESIVAIDHGRVVPLKHGFPLDYHIHGLKITRISTRDFETIWVGLRRYSKEEQIWIHELWHTDGENLQFVTEVGGEIQALLPQGENSLLLGSDRGLWNWDGKTMKEIAPGGRDSSCSARAIAADPNGGILIAGTEGLYRLSGKTCVPMAQQPGSSGINSLHFDQDGRLWAGCGRDGLAVLLENEWHSLKNPEAGIPREVSGVAADDHGGLWLASVTGEGLVRFESKELLASLRDPSAVVAHTHFGKDDGLPSLMIQPGYCPVVKDQPGRIWISTTLGVAAVDPLKWRPQVHSRRVHIQNVLINDLHRRDFVSGISSRPPSPEIVVQPGRRRVEFNYAAVEYTAPESVRYRYRLDGYDELWTEAGQRTTAVYPDLPPGKYSFQVAALAGQGKWREDGSKLYIVIEPLWWERLSNRIAGVIGFVGLLCFAFIVRLRQVNKRTRLQENFARALIRAQEDERKRLASDLHDSLGHELLVLKGDIDRATIQDGNDRLRPISDKAGDAIQMVREISHNLRPPELERFGIAPALESMARDTEEATGIHFETEIQPFERRLQPDIELGLFRIAQEALSNMAKHSDASEGKLILRKTDDHIELIVEDDGRGFDIPVKAASGLGLVGMKERARLLSGNVECLSRKTKGARVSVSLPAVYRSLP